MNDGWSEDKPIRNLRIRFWGVQGSCPLFPEAHEVADYERLAALDLLNKVLRDVEKRGNNGSGCKVEDLLGGPLNDANVAAYQKRLGVSDLPVYGGDTTCTSIETADGHVIVIDCGSGIRNCSKHLVQRWPDDRPREVYIFGTHEHLDHRSGLPFAQFLYVKPPFTIHLYGGYQFLHALDERYGIFTRKINPSTHLDDPIDFRVMAAEFRGNELRNPNWPDFPPSEALPKCRVLDAAEPVQIGNLTVTALETYHGDVRCLAYKFQYGSTAFVFCTDHEVRHGLDPTDPRQEQSREAEQRLVEYCRGVDAAYFDGQYFRGEYDGVKPIGATMAVSRVDWGHSCIEDIIERSKLCRIKRTFVGHHDPERTWGGLLSVDRWLQSQCAGQPFVIELAKSEDMLDL
jgi:hypothetical protein